VSGYRNSGQHDEGKGEPPKRNSSAPVEDS